ncbi:MULTISPECIES: DNA primase [unclassified Anaerobiospirillum]|uniref:DNA primase n=1 Tax=unclassified Anaerobiospirillum TaxID=2647410 RepID=UPI001FF1D8C6|nr:MULTISPECIES: DNA primase [unclassified Anaerobiospirillum]MCK0534427.1 DNA primase [Anaerobiospirillum sp. NML120511]MCK0539775.1 DNA primase [Anaerobiospirillum sp. NML02-A-032]
MPIIKKDYIKNRLIPHIDLVKLVNQFINLKKSGADYTCCCPFHNEKTPSFHVNPRRQTFTCYGCNEWGNAIDFVMKYKNIGFVDAVEELSRFAGLEVEYEEGSGRQFDSEKANKKAYELMDRVAAYFTDALNRNPEAMKYFTEQRALSPELITRARLGFAPDSWDYVAREIARDPSEYRELVELGIQVDRVEDDGRHVCKSFFRGRVMFPIFDIKGRIIAFGGRVFANDFGPKYLNSPETKIFKKRKELFGLYETLQATRNRPEKVVVVEGYMDAIALRQAGFNNIVATLGTAITADHLKTLFRYTGKVICCFDGDEAGKKATWRALQAVTPVLEKSDKEVSFINMPAGHDPDTLVRSEGKEAFEREIKMAVSYSESIILHESKVYDISDPNQRVRFLSSVLSIIKAMKSFSMRMVTLQVLSSYVGTDESTLKEMLNDESITPAAEFMGMDNYSSRDQNSGRRYSRDNRRSYAGHGGYSSQSANSSHSGQAGQRRTGGFSDDGLQSDEGSWSSEGRGGYGRRGSSGNGYGGAQSGSQGNGQGGFKDRNGGYGRRNNSQSRHNWEQEGSQWQSRQRAQNSGKSQAQGAGQSASSGMMPPAMNQAVPYGMPAGMTAGMPGAQGQGPGPFMMPGPAVPQSYAQAQSMGVSTDPAGRPFMPGMGMQVAAAHQGPDQHQISTGPWGREVFYSQQPGVQGRPVSQQEITACATAQMVALKQNTPAAGYMQLGPDGMPAAASGRINAPDGYTGEYYEGGFGPGDNMSGPGDMDYGPGPGPGPDYDGAGMDYDMDYGPGGPGAPAGPVDFGHGPDGTGNGHDRAGGAAGAGAGGSSGMGRSGFRSIIGREFDISELGAPCYRVMSFILQYPTVVASLYEEYQLDRMLEYARELRIDDCPLMEELLHTIRQNPTVSCASLIENYRDTDRQEVIDLLFDCPLLPQREDGQEPPISEKREYFGRTVFEMLQKPFRERFEYLNSSKGRFMSKEDMDEVKALAKIVNRNFGGS